MRPLPTFNYLRLYPGLVRSSALLLVATGLGQLLHPLWFPLQFRQASYEELINVQTGLSAGVILLVACGLLLSLRRPSSREAGVLVLALALLGA
jgi:hypothetical protein